MLALLIRKKLSFLSWERLQEAHALCENQAFPFADFTSEMPFLDMNGDIPWEFPCTDTEFTGKVWTKGKYLRPMGMRCV